jgi:hypothetical protein
MKNFKKRIERLEKILKPIQPLEEPKDPNAVTLDLTFEQCMGLREALESLEIRARQMLEERREKGIPDPTEEEKKRNIQEVLEYMERRAKESQTDEKS